MCLRRRLIDKGKYVTNQVFTHPRYYRLTLNTDKISFELNGTWQIDLIPRIKIKIFDFNFVDKKAREKIVEF